ncbi:hypothetical protein HK102_006130, partial [Quaeritorhiza haematococci]
MAVASPSSSPPLDASAATSTATKPPVTQQPARGDKADSAVWAFVNSDEFQGKYAQVIKLRQQVDPRESPFKSQYEARKILKSLRQSVQDVELDESSGSEEEEKNLVLALIDYHIATNLANTDEATAGEKTFKVCLQNLKPYAIDPLYSVAVVSSLNQLAILWSDWGDHKKAVAFLQESEKLYHEYTKNGIPPIADPLDRSEAKQNPSEEGEQTPEDPWEPIEDPHTYTLYYLAQVYGALKLTDK